MALTTDTSFLTAYANDFDFDGIFARQVQALGKSGDVLLAISTSGRSRNVVQAAELAKRMEMRVIALTGEPSLAGPPSSGKECPVEAGTTNAASPPAPPLLRGGERRGLPQFDRRSGRMPLLRCADVAICIPSDNTQHIQEAHLAVEHILCHLVERIVFGVQGAVVP